MADMTETLRKLGLAAARGVPQLATGFVDLAALPFTMTGMMKPEQAVGSTAYLTSKGLLPPPQEGLLGETTELVSSAMNPATAAKAALAKGGLLASAPIAFAGSIIKNPQPFKVAHGTNAQFDEFKQGMGITGKHIYTTPEEYASDSSSYGKNLIIATASPKKMIDFTDYNNLDKTTINSIKKAAKDAGITDKYYKFDSFLNDLMSGNLYQSGGGQRTQNAFLDELFSKYDAVKMPDAAVGGGLSQSVVFQNPSLLKIQK